MNIKKRYFLKYVMCAFGLFFFPNLKLATKKILKKKKFYKVWILNNNDI